MCTKNQECQGNCLARAGEKIPAITEEQLSDICFEQAPWNDETPEAISLFVVKNGLGKRLGCFYQTWEDQRNKKNTPALVLNKLRNGELICRQQIV
jgi:hypothetical protein